MPDELIVQNAPQTNLAVLPRLDIVGIQQRVADIEALISSLMVKGVHYGPPFPGSDKNSLYQAGAELMFMSVNFVADPEPREEQLAGSHLRVICEGWAKTSDGRPVGRITTECSTMETKYRYRKGGRICPDCGQQIRRSKDVDKRTGDKGWYCWLKADGCGATFASDDPSITSQTPGRIENQDPMDLWNTVRRMSEKRWLVALARRTFALSARFVDQEAAQSAAFKTDQVGKILRAIPGDRREKWNRCISFCLTSFGKGPEQLTQLEGSIFLRWLGEQVSEAAEFKPEDFGDSPEVVSEEMETKEPREGKANGTDGYSS